MKVSKKLFAIVLCLIMGSALLASCSGKEEETPAPQGITVSFVTGFDNIVFDPVYIDGKEDAYMPLNPFQAGYDFLGWYYDQEYTHPFSTADGLTKDTTLYARWSQKSTPLPEGGETKTEEVDEVGIHYLLSDDKENYTVIKYDGTEKNLTVPLYHNGKRVTAIDSGAFAGSEVLSLSFPVSIENIHPFSFAQATYLKTITVAEGNVSYCAQGGILFDKEKKTVLCVPRSRVGETYTLPVTVSSIGKYAFYGCTMNLIFPEGSACGMITSYAFAGFAGSVTLTKDVSEILQDAFKYATCHVVFDKECPIVTLSTGAFDGYRGTELVLPGSLTLIAGGAFNDCTAKLDLTALGMKTIDKQAFYGYIGENLLIPQSVTTIEKGAFYHCTAKVTFDENTSFSTVTADSFNGFSGEVVFPSTVKKVEKNAFYGASASAKIIFSTSKDSVTIDGGAFNQCKGTVEYR